MPAGKQAEQSVKGYFRESHSRRGRKPRRVLASQYGEIVLDALYAGNTRLLQVLPDLVEQAERVLGSTPKERGGTINRLDRGGGSLGSLNRLLERGYAVVSKDYSVRRTSGLAADVTQWACDEATPDREMGWVVQESEDSVAAVRRLVVGSKGSKGRWRYAVLLFAGLAQRDILSRMGLSPRAEQASIMGASLPFYDQRGGGIESSFGQDKSGLGITKGNKKRFEAQRLLMLLGTLAHNLLIWGRGWLAPSSPQDAAGLQQYGIQRMVRDRSHISGLLTFDAQGRLASIALFSAHSLTKLMLAPLRQLLAPSSIRVILDKT